MITIFTIYSAFEARSISEPGHGNIVLIDCGVGLPYRSEGLQRTEQRCLPAHPRNRVLVDVAQHAHRVVVVRIDEGEVWKRHGSFSRRDSESFEIGIAQSQVWSEIRLYLLRDSERFERYRTVARSRVHYDSHVCCTVIA